MYSSNSLKIYSASNQEENLGFYHILQNLPLDTVKKYPLFTIKSKIISKLKLSKVLNKFLPKNKFIAFMVNYHNKDLLNKNYYQFLMIEKNMILILKKEEHLLMFMITQNLISN